MQTKERESYKRRDDYTYVEISQGFIRYKLEEEVNNNKKELIVCIGGLAAPLEMFSVLNRELSSNYRVLRFDFLGRGRSGFPLILHPGPRGEMMIEQLVQILYTLNIREEFHLVGVSMGGKYN